MMSPIADPSILAPYPKKSTWVPPIGREFGCSSPVRVLMADGKWKPGVPDSLKSRYAQPIDCPPPKKGPGPVMYIQRPIRTVKAKPKPKPKVRPAIGANKRFFNVTRENIERLQGDGLSRTDIAKEMGCSLSLITKTMPRGGRPYRHNNRLIPRVAELLSRGAGPVRIAREIGVARNTAVRLIGLARGKA